MDPNVLRLAMGAGGPSGPEYKLYTWGENSWGMLGLGNLTNYSSPKQVGSLATWDSVSVGGSHMLAKKNDGTIWAWGINSGGQLGQQNTINRSSPVQVGTGTNWATITATGYACAAIKTDGTLWSWGEGTYGISGRNSTSNTSYVTQVGSLTNWSKLAQGGSTNTHLAAIKTDGTLWVWGRNNYGQLGIGDTTNRSSPVQVGALTNWSSVSCGLNFTIAIKTDGTLWSWGRNNYGQLGDNTAGTGYEKSSPVQVGALTTWSKVSCGQNFCAAIKTDGTLWTWGSDGAGQLGLNSLYPISKSSPTQVGSLTNWSKVHAASNNAFAIKTDGTLWAWGANNIGRLGLGDTTSRSSPVQVGALTNWYNVSGGSRASAAITEQL